MGETEASGGRVRNRYIGLALTLLRSRSIAAWCGRPGVRRRVSAGFMPSILASTKRRRASSSSPTVEPRSFVAPRTSSRWRLEASAAIVGGAE